MFDQTPASRAASTKAGVDARTCAVLRHRSPMGARGSVRQRLPKKRLNVDLFMPNASANSPSRSAPCSSPSKTRRISCLSFCSPSTRIAGRRAARFRHFSSATRAARPMAVISCSSTHRRSASPLCSSASSLAFSPSGKMPGAPSRRSTMLWTRFDSSGRFGSGSGTFASSRHTWREHLESDCLSTNVIVDAKHGGPVTAAHFLFNHESPGAPCMPGNEAQHS